MGIHVRLSMSHLDDSERPVIYGLDFWRTDRTREFSAVVEYEHYILLLADFRGSGH